MKDRKSPKEDHALGNTGIYHRIPRLNEIEAMVALLEEKKRSNRVEEKSLACSIFEGGSLNRDV